MMKSLKFSEQARYLGDILRERVQNQPEKIAYIFLENGETETGSLTYRELDQQARLIATALRSLVASGERALMLYPQGLEFVTAFFGCLYAGVVAIPVYPPKRNQKLSRLQAIIKDSEATVVLATQGIRTMVENQFSDSELVSLRWLTTDNIVSEQHGEWQEPIVSRETLAFLQYTSGSTGNPKGVMVSHGNLLHNSEYMKQSFKLDEDTVSVTWLPNFHDMGLIEGIIQPLYTGFLAVIMPPTSFVQQPLRWLQAISHYRATHCGSPNFGYEICVNSTTLEQRETLDLSSWSNAYTGSEPVCRETLEKFADAFKVSGFRPSFLYPCYGMAEATLMISGGEAEADVVYCTVEAEALEKNRIVKASASSQKVRHLVGCGFARLDTQIVIADPETLTRCSPQQVGEIWVSGSSVAQGYWKRPELTEEIFKAQLQNANFSEIEESSRSFLRTGDLGFLLDGQLFITGRRKDLIIISGRNHYPQDIELTVEQCHPALRPTGGAAFSIDIDGQERLVIVQEVERTYLRKFNVKELTEAILQAVAQEHDLEVYAILLLKTATLPKTSSGKVQRSACKAGFLANSLNVVGKWTRKSQNQVEFQRTEKIQTQSQQLFTPTQQSLPNKSEKVATLQTWLVSKIADRLQINPRAIDIQAPFVSYGLDSVATVRLTGELEDWLGERVSPTLVYDYPNIATLVSHLSQVLNGNGSDLKIDNPRETRTTTGSNHVDEPIAIIGLGCRFPGASNPEAFWQLLRNGVDVITEIPKNRWDIDTFYSSELETPGKMNTRWGAFLDKVDQFDPDFFGISPREAERMDPQQRLLLEVAWEALENAGLIPSQLAGSETGVFIGISSNDYSRIQFGEHTLIDAYAGTGNAFSIAANRLSYFLDLQGPSLSVDTACSSSLVAVHLACQSLQSGESNLALVGGVNLILSPELTITFSQARMMATDGHCKTFDHQADGYVRGEGCGVVVLKRLTDAFRDQDNILALIKGSAVNQDGRSNGLTAPNGLAQQRVIRKALQKAGITADQLSYVEAHGTGTPLGDPIEFESLKAVLMESRLPNHSCLVGSVKTNIGHLEAAAGIAGLIKVVLSLQNEEIPAHLHLKQLNRLISLQETPLSISTYLQPWISKSPRRFAGVSSFGFGGTNAHVVLESPPDQTLSVNNLESPFHIFTLSAKSESALQVLTRSYVDFLDSHAEASLADICFTTNTGRSHFAYRLAVTCKSTAQLHEQLSAFLVSKLTTDVVTGKLESSNGIKIAFLFTDDNLNNFSLNYQLYQSQSTFCQALEDCDLVLHKYLKKSLLSILDSESSVFSPLQQTEYAKPISFALQYALAKCWLSWGILPSAVLGYGIGEYVAACISGRMELENCLELLVQPRNCPPSEEMAVVFTEAEKAEVRVQWVEVVGTLVTQGYTFLIEQRENRTLNNQCQAAGIRLVSLNPNQNSLPIIFYTLSILYVQGVEINWTNFHQNFTYQRIPLPTYPFERQRYWLETASPSFADRDQDNFSLIESAVRSKTSTEKRLTRYKLLAAKQEYQLEILKSYLCEQLAWVLGRSTVKLDVELSIINFGIDSLMSLELKKRIESDLMVVVPETKFLQGPTITELSLFLLSEITELDGTSATLDSPDKTRKSEGEELSLTSPPSTFASMLQNGQESQSFPLSFPQERMWFLNSLSPENPVYNFQMAIRLSGQLSIEGLKYSIQEVIHRHEILRTTFPVTTTHPCQIIVPELPLPLSVIDLSEMDETEQAGEVKQLAASEVRQPFNFVDGPLLRTTLIRLNKIEY
ncbi:beta-ketoacyl synthase N-terminal-like domain-containing protein [Nodularia spumigena CS-586/05]|uniref:polyketide synthase n=1 Tax=Nodularia spumigena TaxID=70799 RepID=UPI00232F56F4|nr:polyketide synthase [Nodularia spumigena]MDB9369216.1 beta-ketoacyl synthase N-terminal-like domain-containing protein [Nodularia spumigena CS-586/05]